MRNKTFLRNPMRTKNAIEKWHKTLVTTPYWKHKKGQNYKILEKIAKDPNTHSTVLEDLAYLASRKQSPHINDPLLQKKCENIILYPDNKYIIFESTISKKTYAKHPPLSLYWRENDNYFFVGNIAKNPNTNSSTLMFLAQEAAHSIASEYTKNRVNTRLWYETLQDIARHTNMTSEIANFIGYHSLIPEEVKKVLLTNEQCPTQLAVQISLMCENNKNK